jgi:hypothetical protein
MMVFFKSVPAEMKTAALRTLPSLLMLAGISCTLPAAHAALPDEIQVYTDDLNAPGEFGLELHINTALRGQRSASYPGEIRNDHSLYVTPELSWGLTDTMDVGLYLPTARDGASGNFYAAGAKGRFKWLPIRGNEQGGGFAGLNLELGRVAHRFEEYRTSAELRGMLGWRTPEWLFALNPVLSWDLSDGAERRTGYSFNTKLSHELGHGLALGLEYYTDQGKLGQRQPWNAQDNKLFVVLDVDAHPWGFNIGVGKGLSADTEKLTIKGIVEFGF